MTTPVRYPLGKVKVEDMAMELKCVVAVPVLRYLQAEYGADKTADIISETAMSVDYLNDPNNWISFDYYCRLLRKVVDITGNPNTPFESAKLYSNMNTYRALGLFLTHLGSPITMYGLIGQFYFLWSKINKWSVKRLSPTRCLVTVTFPKLKQDPNNCLAIQGSLAAVPSQLGLPLAAVKERQCACKGAESCVYEVEWVNKPVRRYGWIGALFGGVLGTISGWLVSPGVEGVIMGVGWLFLGYSVGRGIDYRVRLHEVYRQNEDQAASLLQSLRDIEELNRDLQRRIDARTNELAKSNEDLQRALRNLKENQERILIAEKQSAIGVLAAGMAHELNSPLNAIRLSIQGLREDVGGDPRLGGTLGVADRAAGRCKRIINDLLSFSRESRREANVRIEDIVESSIQLFEKEHPDGIRIQRQVSVDLPLLRLDRMQIQQVVMNLLKNASEAMKDKGTVTVSLAAQEEGIVLCVSDRGTGIPESVRRNVFDAFFTTKSNEGGMGLGLSISYQLVRRNGGTIELLSREGEGATFVVRFPVEPSVRAEGAIAAEKG